MMLEETTLSSTRVYSGRILDVLRDEVSLPDGTTALREVVEHTGGVCVAALDECDNIYLVEQFRYAHKKILAELPAGKLERGEDPAAAAARELREETGLTAARWQTVFPMYPTPGYSAEIDYLYIATGLTQGAAQLDEGEFLHCKKLPFQEVLRRVLDGDICDAKTATLVLYIAAARAAGRPV